MPSINPDSISKSIIDFEPKSLKDQSKTDSVSEVAQSAVQSKPTSPPKSMAKRAVAQKKGSSGADKKTIKAFGKAISAATMHRAKMERDLSKLDARMGEVQGGEGKFSIEGFGASANPVGRIKNEFFILTKDAKELEKQNSALSSNGNLKTSLCSITQKQFSKQSPAGKKLIQAKFKQYVGNPESVKVGRGRQTPTPEQYLGQIIERMEDDIEDVLQSDAEKNAARTLIDAFSELKESATLEGVPERVEKDGVVSSLRVELSKSDDPKKSEALSKAIVDVTVMPGRYIKTDDLPEENRSVMTRNLPSYVSSMDVMQKNDYSDSVGNKLMQVASSKAPIETGAAENPQYADQPGYAFKTGNENHREVLAGRMADILGVQRYLTPKSEMTMQHGKLGATSSPEGLASKWLSEGTPFKKDAFFSYTQQKAQIAHKEGR